METSKDTQTPKLKPQPLENFNPNHPKTPKRKKEESEETVRGDESGGEGEESARVRLMRRLVLEEARNNIPEDGCGRVRHLVNAFERVTAISKAKKKKFAKWALPGLFGEEEASCSGNASRSFDGGSEVESSSFLTCSNRRSSSGSKRSSLSSSQLVSSGSNWSGKLKATAPSPFKLRTEQRGKHKEEYFINKMKIMLMEEEKLRIPTARPLPLTTDEPEYLVKPPVKEPTEPDNLILNSDLRAVERAEFDHYVSWRMKMADQMKIDRERQQRLEEEEEIRKLRKELVPRAQPMPYFDKPFFPKKSTRPPTVPKEPHFHRKWPRFIKHDYVSVVETT